ncbi:MAG: hypothetical protein HS128_19885 [Ideonella sp.]|nr:hypothetical protein [Ideonella sp.]MCC7458906.1 hypothetical protein [Nitrospira sp.]
MSTTFEAAVGEALRRVNRLREARSHDPRLAARVEALKRFQHERLARDYARLAQEPRHRAATAFFLEDLYGPEDFADRDAEFSRIVPAIARLLPQQLLQTVRILIELHALSEELDQQMALTLVDENLDEAAYRMAWRTIDRQKDRERQLVMLLQVGRSLDRHTHRPLLAATLRLMRAPARAAGLARLQSFLERGLAAFASMNGALDFLATIESNECQFITGMSEREKPG